LTGCQETTAYKPDGEAGFVYRTIQQRWKFTENSGVRDSANDQLSGWVLDVKKDGTYESSNPARSSERGIWNYEEKDSTITLTPSNSNSDKTTIKIITINGSQVRMIIVGQNNEVSMQSQRGPLFSIKGLLHYRSNLSIPRNAKISVLWRLNEQSDKSFVWGHGQVDELNNSFTVDFDSYPPDSIITQFYGCIGRVGVGTIYLHNDPRISSGYTTIDGRSPNNCIGVVAEHAIIFIFGNFKNSVCSSAYMWTGAFSKGFNLGEVFHSSDPPTDYFPAERLTDAVMVVTDNANALKLPVWWKQ
jgi:hypothetical protein